MIRGRRIEIEGIVQGVGFRPWVYRLAQEEGIRGRVRNHTSGVTIEAFAPQRNLESFVDRLFESPPPAAELHHALHHLDLEGVDILFIENVGNLVCPAIYDLGQAANVVAYSVTEGKDKPLKYPVMFRNADLVLITKSDLMPALDGVNLAAMDGSLGRVMTNPRSIVVSSRSVFGIGRWIEWLEQRRDEVLMQQGVSLEVG